MSYQNIENGLYLAKQPGLKIKGMPVTHYGIIDIGNILAHPKVDVSQGPTVIHQTPPEVQCAYISKGAKWIITDRIKDIEGAKGRIKEAVRNKAYDLFGNNCEHFAKYVAKGTKVSGQILVGGVAIVAGTVLIVQLFKWLSKP